MKIDKNISVGSILTIGSIIVAAAIAYGSNTYKMETIKVNEDNIVNLKIGVAKLETQLDDRFDRLEDILMDLE